MAAGAIAALVSAGIGATVAGVRARRQKKERRRLRQAQLDEMNQAFIQNMALARRPGVNPALAGRAAAQSTNLLRAQMGPQFARERQEQRGEQRSELMGLIASAGQSAATGIAGLAASSGGSDVAGATQAATAAPPGPPSIAGATTSDATSRVAAADRIGQAMSSNLRASQQPVQIAETVIDPTQATPGVAAPGVKELANFDSVGDTTMQQTEATLERFAAEQRAAQRQELVDAAEAEANMSEAEARRLRAEREADEIMRGVDTEGLSNAVSSGEAQAGAMGAVRRSAARRRPAPSRTPTPAAETPPAPAAPRTTTPAPTAGEEQAQQSRVFRADRETMEFVEDMIDRGDEVLAAQALREAFPNYNENQINQLVRDTREALRVRR